MNRAKLGALPVVAGLAATLLAGCGVVPGGEDGGTTPIVMGSTDNRIRTLDPAGAYDIGVWTLFTNTFQTLLRYPQDGSRPQPDAAETCVFTDQNSTAYRCTLRAGLKFSNGNTLDARDVEFSISRTMKIADENGPSSLFSNLDRVEAADDTTVVFHLKKPDATLPFVLATPAAAIVDSEVYPADRLIGKDQIAGSGPYTLASLKRAGYDREQVSQAVFRRNEEYRGNLQIKNNGVRVRYFTGPQQMQQALETGEIDLIHRSLGPEQIIALQGKGAQGIKLIEAPGTEIRYLVFNTKHRSVEDTAVRQAIAQLIDRKALVRDVYQRTVEPLHSMIPKGITGHTNAFFNEYGEPSRPKARQILRAAGITQPVRLTVWYTSDHYGVATAEEFKEIKQQLEAGGLFKITLKSRNWSQYQDGYQQGEFEVFGMGWFPDFPDPDNFIAPFLEPDNFLKIPYLSETIVEQVLPRSRQQAERWAVVDEFARAQDIIARDVPLLPLWQGKQYIGTRENIAGVEWTLDTSSTFRFWEVRKVNSD